MLGIVKWIFRNKSKAPPEQTEPENQAAQTPPEPPFPYDRHLRLQHDLNVTDRSKHIEDLDAHETDGKIINYLWIDSKKFKGHQNALCSLPFKLLDKAIENAKRYPEHKFKLWIDYEMTDETSLYLIASHLYIQGITNIEIENLRDIPSYDQCSFFSHDSDYTKSIWARVDTARLLVLQHCLETTKAAQVFYSDFDIDDVGVNRDDVQDILSNHGFVIGHAEASTILENQYFGIGRNDNHNFLQKVIRKTVREISDFASNGWNSMKKAVAKINEDTNHQTSDETFSVPIGPPTGHVIKRIPAYIDIGINEEERYSHRL